MRYVLSFAGVLLSFAAACWWFEPSARELLTWLTLPAFASAFAVTIFWTPDGRDDEMDPYYGYSQER